MSKKVLKFNNARHEALTRFLESFETVFGYDWDFTRFALNMPDYTEHIAPGATFISPDVGDEYNNWGNRGSLLQSYRELCAALGRKPSNGIDDEQAD